VIRLDMASVLLLAMLAAAALTAMSMWRDA
jgi:hypothetical protein